MNTVETKRDTRGKENSSHLTQHVFDALGVHPAYLEAATNAYQKGSSQAIFLLGTTTVIVVNTENSFSICAQKPTDEIPDHLDTWWLQIQDNTPEIHHSLRQHDGSGMLPGSGKLLGKLPIPNGENVVDIFLEKTGIGTTDDPETVRDRRFSQPVLA